MKKFSDSVYRTVTAAHQKALAQHAFRLPAHFRRLFAVNVHASHKIGRERVELRYILAETAYVYQNIARKYDFVFSVYKDTFPVQMAARTLQNFQRHVVNAKNADFQKVAVLFGRALVYDNLLGFIDDFIARNYAVQLGIPETIFVLFSVIGNALSLHIQTLRRLAV